MHRFVVLLLAALLWVATAAAGQHRGAMEPAHDGQQACSAFGRFGQRSFAHTLDAPTQITGTRFIRPSGNTPAFCLVSGYVSPNIGIRMALPEVWSARFVELGCGGYCGILPGDQGLAQMCAEPLRDGYACITSDMGHQGWPGDALWASGNLQAQLDWGYRSAHVTALAGKAIARRFYHEMPARSYFIGGSTGGRQALQEAELFPTDFDGIVSFAPAMSMGQMMMTFLWGNRAAHDANGQPLLGRQDLALLTRAALAKCDLDDGLKDGIISDPLHCDFDPGTLLCRRDESTGCLSAAQIEAARKIYSGPTSSRGERLTLGGPVPGSELGDWDRDPRTGWGVPYLGVTGAGYDYRRSTLDGFRYQLFWPAPGPTWKPRDFDFDRDPDRLGLMQVLSDAGNPDLRRFKAAGGKLLIFQGLNDNSILPRRTIDFYETVERTMGGQRATQSFVRLFLLPGVGHLGGGPGADAIDSLRAIEAWVERHRPPDRLIAAHLKLGTWSHAVVFPLAPADITFTRPVYPYPLRAKYRGHGDPSDAANFVRAASPDHPPAAQPASVQRGRTSIRSRCACI